MPNNPLTLQSVCDAQRRLAPHVRYTSCAESLPLTQLTGGIIYLKREDQQYTGSFKCRGSRNALESMSPEARERGVIAASAGNHALGLALAGKEMGVPVTVVMPVTAPAVKVKKCEALGATVVLCGETFDEAKAEVARRCRENHLHMVHPFDDEAVMAGQGTVALEVLEQVPDLDAIIVPVGGGGLLAGVATVIRSLRPQTLIVGVEPENAACYAAGIAAGGPIVIKTKASFADGLAVAEAGAKTLLSHHLVDRVLTVSEGAIGAAMREILSAEGATVEGAGAVAVAACLGNAMPYLWGKKVVCLVSGGNVDAATHSRAITGDMAAA